jgi:hypothetical protein
MKLIRSATVVAAILSALPVIAQETTGSGLPLPKAMIRLSIPDVPAFDRALGGGFRNALLGTLPAEDGVAAGFRQSQVGAKLVDQWSRFDGETGLSFKTIVDLQTTALALAVLNIGHLEMVLVLETPAASLPDILEEGTSRVASGRTYHLIRTGAADEGADGETRMGLAWAKDKGLVIIATSERAMKLALEAAARGDRFAPTLAGLTSLELDMDALHRDLYFKRDYFFDAISDAAETRGLLKAALRNEANRLVEVREGTVAAVGAAKGASFEAPSAAASGWINDGSQLLAELRRGVLEPLPAPSLTPRLSVAPLPSAKAATAEDRYAVNIENAVAPTGGSLSEAAEIEQWTALLASQTPTGFGYVTTKARSRMLAVPWPKERDAEFAGLLEATLTRRGARLAPGSSAANDVREYRFGPSLPALAFKRSGDFLWIGRSAADVRTAPVITWNPAITRFSKLDLTAARADARRWRATEGPRSSESARPFSDRVLGLLGWMPTVRTFEVERRVTGAAFTERVTFGFAPNPPAATPAASATPAPAPVK